LRKQLEESCKFLGKELLFVPEIPDVLLYSATSHQLDDLLIFSMPPLQLTPLQRFLKRACDILGALFLLVLCGPAMALLYVLIPIESHGPAIFRQERRGFRRRSFEILKFRTMVADAEESSGPVLASLEDPRVTRFGNLLRATRLDELPQLFNVLRGEMSLVGPRPEREFFASHFDHELPNYCSRTAVKPGLTGLAQVWGGYSTTAEDKLRLDLMYIANYSLFLDFNLLLQTLRVVLYRSQSAGLDESSLLRFGLTPVARVEKRREA
jgi:exopolysaccharide biosynthesis polyprenyl glycosylphosphotransferase